MHRYSIFLLSLLTVLPARANLGDNVKQCVARYGAPISYSEANAQTPFGTLLFVDAGYALMVFLLGDKEVGARVTKTDKTAFTDAERQTIMNADLGGSQWTATTSARPDCVEWSRADQATVIYDTKNKMLIFTSEEMAKALLTAPTGPDPAVKPQAVKPAAGN